METKKSNQIGLEKNRTVFFLIGTSISLALVFMAFEWTTNATNIKELSNSGLASPFDWDVPPVTRHEEPIQPKVELPKIAKAVESIKIVHNNTDTEPFNPDNLISDVPFTPIERIEMPRDTEEVMKLVNLWELTDTPHVKGGMKAFYNALSDKLVYPEEALTFGESGKVFVSFIIDANGKMKNFEVVKGAHASMNKAALEALNAIDIVWTPGKQAGVAVPVKMQIPIHFKAAQ